MTGTVQSGSGRGHGHDHHRLVDGHDFLRHLRLESRLPPAPGRPCSAAINASGVVAKAVADYFAGLNFGFIGSTEANPNMPGKTIGNSPS